MELYGKKRIELKPLSSEGREAQKGLEYMVWSLQYFKTLLYPHVKMIMLCN